MKTFKPDSFEVIFDIAIDLEGINREAKRTLVVDRKGSSKFFNCSQVGLLAESVQNRRRR